MTRLASWQDFGTHDESAYPELWRGCIGAWAPCFGPTGTRLHDLSRYRNWGTLTNMDAATDWVVSGGRYALDFDGVNDFCATPFIGTYDLNTLKTVSAWINARSFDGAFQTNDIINTDHISLSRGWQLNASDFNNNDTDAALTVYAIGSGGGDRYLYSAEILTVNRWHHIAFTTTDGLTTVSAVQLFIDGVAVSFTNGSTGTYGGPRTLNSNNSLNLARRPDNAGQDLHFNGLIDSVMLHDRPLSPAEVRLLATRRGIAYERRKRRSVYVPQISARRRKILTGQT